VSAEVADVHSGIRQGIQSSGLHQQSGCLRCTRLCTHYSRGSPFSPSPREIMDRTAIAALWFLALCSSSLPAQTASTALAERVQQIVNRPEYRRSSFGVAFYD